MISPIIMSWTRIMVLGFCFTLLCGMGAENGYAQVDNCLFIHPDSLSPQSLHMNSDSVAIDTCSSSPTNGHWYSKRFEVFFKVNAFHLGYASPDSILIVHWENIDTMYSALRDSFHSIYNKRGPYYFQKIRPQDTSFTYDGFKMIFNDYHLAWGYDRYVSYGGVMNDLDTIWTAGLIEAHLNTPNLPPDHVSQPSKFGLSWSFSDNALNIRVPLDLNLQSLNFQIFDLLGRKIIEKNQPIQNFDVLKVNLQDIRKGTYFLYLEKLQTGFLFIR